MTLEEKALVLAKMRGLELSSKEHVLLAYYGLNKPVTIEAIVAVAGHSIDSRAASRAQAAFCNAPSTKKDTPNYWDNSTVESIIWNGRRKLLNGSTLCTLRRTKLISRVKEDGTLHRGKNYLKEDGRIYHVITDKGKQAAEKLLYLLEG
jgi:hypothetical protein